MGVTPDGGSPDADADTDADTDTDADADTDTDTDTDADTDSGTDPCGSSWGFQLQRARMLIVQDASEPLGDAEDLLDDVLTTWSGQTVQFGLDLYPDGSQDPGGGTACGVDAPVTLDAAPGNEQAIIDRLDSVQAGGSAPLYCELEKLLEPTYAPALHDESDRMYLLVVSGGGDTCGDQCRASGSSTPAALADLTGRLLAVGIQTLVIGFGAEADAVELDAIAAAGGTEYATRFDAGDPNAFIEAMKTIAPAEADEYCVFFLSDFEQNCTDPGRIEVSLDDEVVALDEGCSTGTGWRWMNDDPTTATVELCDEPCTAYKSGAAEEVEVVVGCW